MEFTDQELRRAAIAVCRSMLAGLEAQMVPDAGCLAVSPGFERRLKGLIQRRLFWRRAGRIAQQAAAVLVILAVSAALWLAVDHSAWASFSGWVREIYENSYVYRYFNPDTGEELGDYEITGLPEEYEVEVILQGEDTCIKKYQKGENELLLSYFKTNDDIKIFVDMMDSVEIKHVEINGYHADYYTYDDAEFANEIVWTDTATKTTFQLSGFFDEEKMIVLAESIRLIK